MIKDLRRISDGAKILGFHTVESKTLKNEKKTLKNSKKKNIKNAKTQTKTQKKH